MVVLFNSCHCNFADYYLRSMYNSRHSLRFHKSGSGIINHVRTLRFSHMGLFRNQLAKGISSGVLIMSIKIGQCFSNFAYVPFGTYLFGIIINIRSQHSLLSPENKSRKATTEGFGYLKTSSQDSTSSQELQIKYLIIILPRV